MENIFFGNLCFIFFFFSISLYKTDGCTKYLHWTFIKFHSQQKNSTRIDLSLIRVVFLKLHNITIFVAFSMI